MPLIKARLWGQCHRLFLAMSTCSERGSVPTSQTPDACVKYGLGASATGGSSRSVYVLREAAAQQFGKLTCVKYVLGVWCNRLLDEIVS